MDIAAEFFLGVWFLFLFGLVFSIARFPYLLLVQFGWIIWLSLVDQKSLEATNDALSNHIYLISFGWLPAIISSVFIVNGWHVDGSEEYFRGLENGLSFNFLLFSIVAALLFLLYLLFRKFSSQINQPPGRVRLRISLVVALMPFAFSLFYNLAAISYYL